jgi:Substrate binding domain of ABC-type glycine betaine transport system
MAAGALLIAGLALDLLLAVVVRFAVPAGLRLAAGERPDGSEDERWRYASGHWSWRPVGGGGLRSGNPLAGGGSAGTVVVGSADFTESELLMEVYAAALRKAGVEVRPRPRLGSREITKPVGGAADPKHMYPAQCILLLCAPGHSTRRVSTRCTRSPPR